MNLLKVTLLCLPLVLLSTASQADPGTLAKLLSKSAAALEVQHRRAKKALVFAAQDRRFEEYFATASEDHRHEVKNEIDQIALKVQSRFHVEEMCLIDQEGAEISRIVGNQVAHDLATNESEAIFFEPGFSQAPRQVHVSPVYMSPDANKWVVAYVTPVVAKGDKDAILHYEHSLQSYQALLEKTTLGPHQVLLAVSEDGLIVFDSRDAIQTEIKNDSERREDYFEPFSLAGRDLTGVMSLIGAQSKGAGRVSDNDRAFDLAVQRVENWYLVAYEPG